jgi:predicted  nucleic acid-binding Zn-ribbon protein
MVTTTDYDGAWKETLELYFKSFLELCFPSVAKNIDWQQKIEFLDKELEEVVRDAALGKQRVDKLVKVNRLDGVEEWILVHVEVQSQIDMHLSQRMYQYYHRIRERSDIGIIPTDRLVD